MPQHKQFKGFARRHLLATLLYFVPAAIAFYFAWGAAQRNDTPALIRHVALFAVLICAGAVIEFVRFRKARCPDCGQLTIRQGGSAGEPISFVCKSCDTIWQTPLRVADD